VPRCEPRDRRIRAGRSPRSPPRRRWWSERSCATVPKNTNALSGRGTPKRALLRSTPTTSRELVEVLWSPRDHRDHLYRASMSPATRDVKLFLEPLPRSWECRLQPSLRASALSTPRTSLLPPQLGGARYGFTGDRRSSGNRAGRGPPSIARRINVAVRHPSLRAAWLMMTVPLPSGEKGAAQSLIRAEAQVVIRAHPRTPPRRSTAKKSVSSFHTW